jgi:hypothetical protein
MKYILLYLTILILHLSVKSQDIENELHSNIWHSDNNLVNNQSKTLKNITFKLTTDSTKKYEIKFLYNNKLHFSWLSEGGSFDETGLIVPAGKKFENSNYNYFIRGNYIKIYNVVTYAKTGKSKIIEYFYKININANDTELEFIPIKENTFYR